MQLATYIKDLLYRYECVIIPGFGAFLTQNRSAHIDSVSHTFYPPNKTLSFNRQLQTNDGILANYVATVEGCSYEIALQKIRNFTGKIALELSEGKTVTLKHIGEFLLNAEQTIQFTPQESQNYNTSAFGLSTFVSSNIERQSAQVVEKDVVDLHKERSAAFPFIKYAAVGVIALIIGGYSGLSIYQNKIEQHNYVEKKKADALLDSKIQEATFIIDNPLPALTLNVIKETGKYHIVAGAFRVEANAQKKISQLAQKGYTARLIGKNKYGLHQVVYNTYSDRLEALQNLRRIKRTENKDAWLLVQKLN